MRYLYTGRDMILEQSPFVEGIPKHRGTSGVVSKAVMENCRRPFLTKSGGILNGWV